MELLTDHEIPSKSNASSQYCGSPRRSPARVSCQQHVPVLKTPFISQQPPPSESPTRRASHQHVLGRRQGQEVRAVPQRLLTAAVLGLALLLWTGNSAASCILPCGSDCRGCRSCRSRRTRVSIHSDSQWINPVRNCMVSDARPGLKLQGLRRRPPEQ